MLIENMAMAFHAIKANKMRSFLTMLGIIIGIGSVISIVSIGDTMRGLFQDLYKDVGITQAYVQIGYWIDDVRMTDYFTLDDLDKIKEVFGDEIAYIDSSAYLSTDVQAGRTKMKFEFTGIDYNYQDVQPVDVIYGRYLNEGDVLGRRKNLVMEAKSAEKLFGTENAVGKSLRMTVYGETDEYTVVGVYKKEMNAFQALMMGTGSDTGAAFIPYTILTWPNDNFYSCRLFAADDVDMTDFMNRLMAYIAKQKDRKPEDFYSQTAVDGDGQCGQYDGSPVRGCGWDRSHFSPGGRHRHYEHHAGLRYGADPGDRDPEGSGSQDPGRADPVPDRIGDPLGLRRHHRRGAGGERGIPGRHGPGTSSGHKAWDHFPGCGILRGGGDFLRDLSGLPGGQGRSHRRPAVRIKIKEAVLLGPAGRPVLLQTGDEYPPYGAHLSFTVH